MNTQAGKPIRTTAETASKIILTLFSVLLLLSSALLPAVCADTEIELNQLLEADGYFVLHAGEEKEMQEGYEIFLKSFGSDTVLLDIYNTGTEQELVGSVVLKEGETIQCYRTYRENTSVVLMLTLDKIYKNNSQLVAGFSHVYQYKDPYAGRYPTSWTLETSVLEDPSVPTLPKPLEDENKTPPGNTDVGTDLVDDPRSVIMIIALVAIVVIIVALIFKKRIEHH